MKLFKRIQTIGMISVALLGLVALSACGPTAGTDNADNLAIPVEENFPEESALVEEVALSAVDEEGATTIVIENLDAAFAQIPSSELSQAEIDGLLFMREEEKLARDVYLQLYEIWELPLFQNIAESEQTHTEAVLTLITRYELDDPAASTDVGEFINIDLQSIYDQLVAQGSQSLVDALKVGAAIEEIDILDLEEQIANTADDPIIIVYQNLMKGSRNHLRAFVSSLERQTSEEYIPQVLSSDAYEEIIGSQIERGGNGDGQGRNAGKRTTNGV